MSSDVSTGGSPFHYGEHEAQARVGVREKMEAVGRRMIRDHMPDDHRQLYSILPFLIVGSIDSSGRPWASLMAGRPGFLSTPDDRTLAVAARPLFADPLAEALHVGSRLGVLGILPGARRRNRLSGRIVQAGPDGFSIAVDQAFGNCPKYIQARGIECLEQLDAPKNEYPCERFTSFDAAAERRIELSDTLFIATAYSGARQDEADGVDVSHRGGRPGFVKVEDDRTFVMPDFSGNYAFNTIGNILTNPKSGFLFIDFAMREILYLTGRSEIVWEGAEVAAFEGAQRLVRFHLDQGIRVEGSLPLRFNFADYSPFLARTGTWG